MQKEETLCSSTGFMQRGLAPQVKYWATNTEYHTLLYFMKHKTHQDFRRKIFKIL